MKKNKENELLLAGVVEVANNKISEVRTGIINALGMTIKKKHKFKLKPFIYIEEEHLVLTAIAVDNDWIYFEDGSKCALWDISTDDLQTLLYNMYIDIYE